MSFKIDFRFEVNRIVESKSVQIEKKVLKIPDFTPKKVGFFLLYVFICVDISYLLGAHIELYRLQANSILWGRHIVKTTPVR